MKTFYFDLGAYMFILRPTFPIQQILRLARSFTESLLGFKSDVLDLCRKYKNAQGGGALRKAKRSKETRVSSKLETLLAKYHVRYVEAFGFDTRTDDEWHIFTNLKRTLS